MAPRLVRSSRAPQSIAFAVTCAARPPRPFGQNLSRRHRGFTCVTGWSVASLRLEGLLSPRSAHSISAMRWGQLRGVLDLPRRDLHPRSTTAWQDAPCSSSYIRSDYNFLLKLPLQILF